MPKLTPEQKEAAKLLEEIKTKERAIPPAPEAIMKAAKEIYESGNFLKYCKESFAKVWLGDQHILEGILYTTANARVLNAKDGIHLHISGQTQTGKSDGVKAAMQFIHPSDRLIKTFSMKYLFYADEELHPNTVIFSDDTTFEPETASLYRNMLTSWFTGVVRGTVVNHAKKDLRIPPRVSLILTSLESVVLESDDGQDESRFLTLEVRRSAEQMKAIRAFIQEDHADIKPSLDMIYAVWDLIPSQNIKIHKAMDRDIPIREFKRFLTLIQAHALLCNRPTTNDDDIDAIEKFLSYSRPMINSTTAAFTRKEAAVKSVLTNEWKTVADIVTATKMPLLDVYRALRGNKGTFQNPSGGLMQKEIRLVHEEERSEFQNNIHSFKLRL